MKWSFIGLLRNKGRKSEHTPELGEWSLLMCYGDRYGRIMYSPANSNVHNILYQEDYDEKAYSKSEMLEV